MTNPAFDLETRIRERAYKKAEAEGLAHLQKLSRDINLGKGGSWTGSAHFPETQKAFLAELSSQRQEIGNHAVLEFLASFERLKSQVDELQELSQ